MDACAKQTPSAEATAWAQCETPSDLKVNRTSWKLWQTSRGETIGYYSKYLTKQSSLPEYSSSDILDASSISMGRILSPMMWFGHIQDNCSCQILSVNGACPSLVICAVPTPVNTTPELSGPAFGVLPKTGDEELEDRGKPG